MLSRIRTADDLRRELKNVEDPFNHLGGGYKQYWGGSCQYEGIGDVFYSRIHLRHIPFPEWCDALQVKCTWREQADPREALEEFISLGIEEEAQYYEGMSEHDRVWVDEERADAEKLRSLLKQELTLQEVVEALFKYTQEAAWDLWSAGPAIADTVLKDLEISTISAPGFGPLLNVLCQNDNYSIGIYLVALLEAGLLTEEFANTFDFDT